MHWWFYNLKDLFFLTISDDRRPQSLQAQGATLSSVSHQVASTRSVAVSLARDWNLIGKLNKHKYDMLLSTPTNRLHKSPWNVPQTKTIPGRYYCPVNLFKEHGNRQIKEILYQSMLYSVKPLLQQCRMTVPPLPICTLNENTSTFSVATRVTY